MHPSHLILSTSRPYLPPPSSIAALSAPVPLPSSPIALSPKAAVTSISLPQYWSLRASMVTVVVGWRCGAEVRSGFEPPPIQTSVTSLHLPSPSPSPSSIAALSTHRNLWSDP